MRKTPDNVLKAVDKMPAFPKSVQQVLELTADINCLPKDLVNVIKNDPVFTLKILKVVNSPFMGLASKITSIHQASVYLGVNTLKNLSLSLACIGTLPPSNKAGFDMNGFWLHSLAVATMTRRLAEHCKVPRNEAADYFSAGLLHDIGKVVFALYMPEEYAEALALAGQGESRLFEAEEQTMNVNHAQIGTLLAEKWGFPESLVQSIASHHGPFSEMENSLIVDCVFAANQVCKFLEYGFSGDAMAEDFPDSVRNRFGMDLERVSQAMPDMTEELERARIFINA